MDGLLFGGVYLPREICVSKSIDSWKSFTVFALPPGAYIWRGDLTEGFWRYWIGGLIFEGAFTWRGLFSEFYGIL